jgi:polysaccharide pyruvyl transferase CsaB
MMPKILIGGYYGANNMGDEAILTVMLNSLRAKDANTHFVVVSRNPEHTTKQHGVEAVDWKDIPALLAAGQQADLIVLGGGGLFQDYWGLDPDYYLRTGYWDIVQYGSLPLLAKLLEIPCMIYGVGIGPLESELAREHTRLACERADVLTLRDTASLDLLCQAGFDPKDPARQLEILPDPVFTLHSTSQDEEQVSQFLEQKKIDADVQLIGVSLRYWDRSGPPWEWLPYIAEGLNRFLAQNNKAQVLLIPFQTNDESPYTNDAVVLKKLYEYLAESWRIHLLDDPISAGFTQALIGRCSVLVGMRLHALILGINTGVPVVALTYDPKISILMKDAGLSEFCNLTLTPKPDELARQIQKAFDERELLRPRLQEMHQDRSTKAQRYGELALGLLRKSPKAPLRFSQQFALEQLLLFTRVDQKLLQVEAENQLLAQKLAELEHAREQLVEIESSRFVRFARAYYRLSESGPLRYPRRFISMLRQEGPLKTIHKAAEFLTSRAGRAAQQTGDLAQVTDGFTAVNSVVYQLNQRRLKGVFVLTSAFVFDELYNQRVINLAKFLAMDGWGVIYVAWRWSKDEFMPGIGQEVYKNLFQLPVDMFLEHRDVLTGLINPKRYFVAEFPHPEFLSAALQLRRYNFKIVYEIIDEWEEFHRVGQAIWFNPAVEESLVLNANLLTAVAPALVEKFSHIRKDIQLSPNGFDPAVLGKNNALVARKNLKRPGIHIGYFGHLTDSWFDWDFIFRVVDAARQRNIPLEFHLIGYGNPNLDERLQPYQSQIHLYGKVNPSDLHRYARDWDVAMIPFKPGKLSEAVDPIKIYEYLYFGLPVIVTGILHLENLPAVTVVKNENEFIDAVLAWPGNKTFEPLDMSVHTWEQRFRQLLETLEREEWMFL